MTNGSKHNTSRLYRAAATKSNLSKDINILEIPHPGQCRSVIKLNTHGIPQPVKRTKNAYTVPAPKTIPAFDATLHSRFFSSFFIFISIIKRRHENRVALICF